MNPLKWLFSKMDIFEGHIITPWKIKKIISQSKDVFICDVDLIDESDLNKDRIKRIKENKWVIKIRPFEIPELPQLLLIKSCMVPNSIEFPSTYSNYYNFGTCKDYHWYVMKKYVTCDDNMGLYKNDWKKIAISCLQFVSKLHKQYHVYLDFKLENIFFNPTYHTYIIGDYDSVSQLTNSTLEYYQNDYLFYYISKGCYMEDKFKSYKTDLIIIGYLLCKLYYNEEWYNSTYTWEYEYTCNQYRTSEINGSVRKELINRIIKERNDQINEIINTNDILKSYFKIINEFEFSDNYPSIDLYNSLINLFK